MILCLVGRKGSGKSLIASHLQDTHGFKRIRFADPLKDMLRSLGLNDREIDGSKKEEPSSKLCGATPRHAMQTLGTEWGRKLIHEDLWTTIWKLRVLANRSRNIVAEDCRFPNEAEIARGLGAKIWLIDRPSSRQRDDHPSESEMANIVPDRTITNNRDKSSLIAAVDAALRLEKEGRK